MQSIKVKDENGAILAWLHVPEGAVKVRERNGVTVEEDRPSAMHSPGRLELSKTWDVSMTHITKGDATLLECCVEESSEIYVHQYREGFWLLVPSDEVWEELMEKNFFATHGFSGMITHLLSIARSHNVRYVRLDADGPVYDYLQEFHW
jgi:hypothetical protein